MKTASVTVIGDAFIDIIVRVNDIEPGGAYQRSMNIACGGTANVAILVSRLGERSQFIGRVGDDALGAYFEDNLQRDGVEGLISTDKSAPTGVCLSLVDKGGERTMLTNRGANDFITKQDIEKHIDDIVNSKILYFSGYSLLAKPTLDSILYAMKRTEGSDCRVWFNPGAPNIIKDHFKEIILNFVDVLILNLEEARKITDKNNTEEILSALHSLVPVAVITVGKGGCTLLHDGNSIQVPPDNVIENVFDTTGAGDAFAAGFIVGTLRQMDKVECAKLGNETAVNFLKERSLS